VPKIDWAALPPKVKEHLLDRARVREMDANNLTEFSLDQYQPRNA